MNRSNNNNTKTNTLRRFIAAFLIYAQCVPAIAAIMPNSAPKSYNASIHEQKKQQAAEANTTGPFAPLFNYMQTGALNNLSITNSLLGLNGPLNWGVTYSDLTGTYLNGQYIVSLGKSLAFGALGEYGSLQYRLNGTLGYGFSPMTQMKFTAERLGQKLPFQFDSGSIDSRVHQDAYGVRLQNLFNSPFFQGINVGGYYAQAANARLNPLTFISNGRNCSGFEAGLTCINYRNIAGATSFGSDIGAELILTPTTLINSNLYYDSVRYNTILNTGLDKDRRGLGIGIQVNQLVSDRFKIIGEATTREIYDTYQVGVNWLPNISSLGMELSLTGQHITSHNATSNNNNINLQVTFLADGAKHYNDRHHWGSKKINAIAQWVQSPAVRMNQVLAVAEQITKVLAPYIAGITPNSGALSGGNTITITGSNFAKGVMVFFGGQLATNVLVLSPSILQVIVPPLQSFKPGKQVVDVLIQNPDGQTATLAASYTYGATTTAPIIQQPANNTTTNTSTITVSGKGVNGNTIKVNENGGLIATTTVGSDSNWTTSVTLPNGTHILSVTQTDPQGTVSPVTTVTVNVAVVVDAPTISQPTDGAIVGTTTTINGTGVAGNTITITDTDGTVLGSLIVPSGGSWTLPIHLTTSPATHTLSITQTDSVGNVSQTITRTVIVDAALAITINPVSGNNIINAEEVNTLGLTVTGSTINTETGNQVVVMLNGVQYFANTLADGSWSVNIPATDLQLLTNGNIYPLSATVTNVTSQTANTSVDVTVNTTLPTISINTVPVNDVINADEQAAGITVTGSTTNTQIGNKVTVALGGKTYHPLVLSGGGWTLALSSSDLQQLTDGPYTISASVVNDAGNSNSATRSITVNTLLPVVTINMPFTDGVLNFNEAQAGASVSGSVTNANEGDIVTVTFGSLSTTAEVQSNLSWTASFSSAQLTSLTDGPYTITASLTNTVGNKGTGNTAVTVSITNPTVSINPISNINLSTKNLPLTLNGFTTNAPVGSSIDVVLNGSLTFPGSVNTGGVWSVTIPGTTIATLITGSQSVEVTVTTSAGNTNNISATFNVDYSSLTPTIDPVSTNNVLNASELLSDLNVTGTTGASGNGQSISLTFDNMPYFGTVNSTGQWSITLPQAALGQLTNGNSYSLNVTAFTAGGNSGSVSSNVLVNTTPPTITINPVDPIIINTLSTGLTITGTTEAGNTDVNVVLAGHNFGAANVLSDGSWSLNLNSSQLNVLSGLYETAPLVVTATDQKGNVNTVQTSVRIETAGPGLFMNNIADTNSLNAPQLSVPLLITGTSMNIAPGTIVTFTMPVGTAITTAITSDGSWSLSVPTAQLQLLTSGIQTFSSQVTTINGLVTSPHSVNVDTTPPVFYLNIAPMGAGKNNILNAVDMSMPVSVSGTSLSLPTNTQIVLQIDGNLFGTTLTQADGTWTTTVPPIYLTAGSHTITASDTITSLSSSITIQVNASDPTITMNPIATINATGITTPQSITGTSSAIGRTVTILFNNKTYYTYVEADGTWALTLPVFDLQVLNNDGSPYTLSASVSDAQGNPASTALNVNVDITKPIVTINPIATNNIINAVAAATSVTVDGTVSGASAGSQVTINFGPLSYNTVVQSDGSWGITISTPDIQSVTNGNVALTTTVTTASGNIGKATANLLIATQNPSITLDTVATDNKLSPVELTVPLVVTGSAQSFSSIPVENSSVTVTFNGAMFTTTVDSNQTWSITIPKTILQNLEVGQTYALSATITDSVGNTGITSRDIPVVAE